LGALYPGIYLKKIQTLAADSRADAEPAERHYCSPIERHRPPDGAGDGAIAGDGEEGGAVPHLHQGRWYKIHLGNHGMFLSMVVVTLTFFKNEIYFSYCCIAGKLPEECVRASALGGDRGAGCGVCGGEVGGGQRAEAGHVSGS
jgi:hypothetical protein